MEAVPKLPFISFPLKTSTEPVDFATKLKQFIRNQYGEDQEAYSKEIRELEAQRQSACRVPKDSIGCTTLKKYYSQLQLLQSRFPMRENESASVMFSWNGAYSAFTSYCSDDIKYEQCCVLYNIGALHSELGAAESRNTSEGMKMACTHFQCAAWAFQQLRESEFPISSRDLSSSLLSFYTTVMLSQAQECILEKSMLDNRKSTIVAKISAQIVDFYKQALKILDDSEKAPETTTIGAVIGSKLLKSWKKQLEFKIAYNSCITLLYLGNQAEELQKMGERVAYFQGAFDKLNESAKVAKGMDKDVNDALVFTMDVVGGKLNAASKENEFVYHEKVPSLESLPEVKGASLVKGIPFDPNDMETYGPDIFARLVPLEAHEASSLYSEEKAKILRRIGKMINEKDEELKVFSSCVQFEQLKVTFDGERLPQELVDCCAAISVQPTAVKNLISTMQALSGKFHDVDSLLMETQEMLDDETKKEKECQASSSPRPSAVIAEISKELAKYKEAHEKAGESNVTLHKAMDYHIANLNLLSGSLDGLNNVLPSINSLNLSDSSDIKELHRLEAKVEEMKNQRKMLEHMLREQLQADDITKKIVTTDAQHRSELFTKEIKKHDQQVMYIEQNLSAQDNILRSLTEVNARCADSRQAIKEINQRREAMIQGLCSSYEAYEDLNSKSQKGLEFYKKLEANILKLLQRLRSVRSAQEEERAAVVKKQQRKELDSMTSTSGPKLKDFLKFGNVFGKDAANQRYMSANLRVAEPPSNVYLPQTYNNLRQQTDLPILNNIPSLPPLPSELRLPPVGSENEPTSYKANSQPQPNISSVAVHYNTSYVDQTAQPVSQLHYNQIPKADGYAAPDRQRFQGGNVAATYANTNWSSSTSSSQMANVSVPNQFASERRNIDSHMMQQPYMWNDNTNPYATSSTSTVYGNTGHYNSTLNPYSAETNAIQSSQLPNTNFKTAPHFTPTSVPAGNINDYYSYQFNQPISSGQNFGQPASSQLIYNPNQFGNIYSPAQTGYSNMGTTPEMYSQNQQTQFSGNLPIMSATPEPLQPQVVYYKTTDSIQAPVPSTNVSQSGISTPAVTKSSLPNSNVELLKQLDVSKSICNDTLVASKERDNSDKPSKSSDHILKPKVLSVEEFIKQKDTTEKEIRSETSAKDPFSEKALEKFVLEVERFQKTVEGLTKQSLNGPTPLEQKWKELLDTQDRESRKLSISVARCYSMKNRVPDIMPYDSNRVLLTSSNDDYINASYLKNVSKNAAHFIATQAPLVSTYKDLWAMIYEQQTEIMVMILSDAELRGDIYWPKEKGFSVDHGHLCVSLRNMNTKPWGIERIISIVHRETKLSRTIMHLQFTGWPPGGIPTSPALFLQFVSDVNVYYNEQRNSSRPIVVHCSAGVGRTGVFCLVSTAVREINVGTGIIDLWSLAFRMATMRKYMMQDKEHMKFALYAVLYYAEDCLLKRGILIKRASFDDKVSGNVIVKSHTRHPSQDYLFQKIGDDSVGEVASTIPAVDDVDKTSINRSRSGSNASVASLASTGSGTIPTPTLPANLPSVSPIHKASRSSQLPGSFANLDIDNFTLDLMPQKTKKITKESFLNPVTGGVKDRQLDPNDPLSQLDPLWNSHN